MWKSSLPSNTCKVQQHSTPQHSTAQHTRSFAGAIRLIECCFSVVCNMYLDMSSSVAIGLEALKSGSIAIGAQALTIAAITELTVIAETILPRGVHRWFELWAVCCGVLRHRQQRRVRCSVCLRTPSPLPALPNCWRPGFFSHIDSAGMIGQHGSAGG